MTLWVITWIGDSFFMMAGEPTRDAHVSYQIPHAPFSFKQCCFWLLQIPFLHKQQSGQGGNIIGWVSLVVVVVVSSLHWVALQAVLQKLSIAGWLRAHGKFVRPELTKQQKQDLKECFELIDTDGSGIHSPCRLSPYSMCTSIPSLLSNFFFPKM